MQILSRLVYLCRCYSLVTSPYTQLFVVLTLLFTTPQSPLIDIVRIHIPQLKVCLQDILIYARSSIIKTVLGWQLKVQSSVQRQFSQPQVAPNHNAQRHNANDSNNFKVDVLLSARFIKILSRFIQCCHCYQSNFLVYCTAQCVTALQLTLFGKHNADTVLDIYKYTH